MISRRWHNNIRFIADPPHSFRHFIHYHGNCSARKFPISSFGLEDRRYLLFITSRFYRKRGFPTRQPDLRHLLIHPALDFPTADPPKFGS